MRSRVAGRGTRSLYVQCRSCCGLSVSQTVDLFARDAQSALNNETFGYTAREHLASATGPYGSIGYTYDGVGNRTAQDLNPGSGLLTDTYSYLTTDNRLQSIALGAGGDAQLYL